MRSSFALQLIIFLFGIVFLVVHGAKTKIPKSPAAPVEIGKFKTLAHKVSSGTVTIMDSRTIKIKNFRYDGGGPDAYFWVGKGSTPDDSGRKIPNEKGSLDVLDGYDNQDIELVLPSDITFNDINWLAVYCVQFDHNFGHVLIPKDLNVPPYQP